MEMTKQYKEDVRSRRPRKLSKFPLMKSLETTQLNAGKSRAESIPNILSHLRASIVIAFAVQGT